MTETLAEKWFDGHDLGLCGLVVSEISGVHDLPDAEIARTFIGGRDHPSDVQVRNKLVEMRLKCVVAKDTHDELVTALKTLRGLMSPALEWCEFRLPSDRSGERTFARSKGFGISIDSIPFDQNAVEWTWGLERYPWWEDLATRTATIAAATGTIYNTGLLDAYPIYTCTAGAAFASGLTFSVGGVTFSYTGAIGNGQVLVVYTDLPDVTLQGTRDFANTSSSAEFPLLSPGANAVVKSSANFTLAAAFRRRNP